jgi:hypothetical protein
VHAAQDERPAAVVWLLEHDANPDACPYQGCGALHLAAAFGALESVRLLIAAWLAATVVTECPEASEALAASVLARIGQLLPELAGDIAESASRQERRTAYSAAR